MSTRWQRFRSRIINLYPPLIGAGIRVVDRSPDGQTIRVQMKLTRLNRNIVGTHFGGSLYAMCDPFFMLILMEKLGSQYIVWDKAASIRFVRPGRGTVHATFHIPTEKLEEIRECADRGEKVEPVMQVDVVDDANQVIAQVEKLLYIRRKDNRSK